MLKKTEHLLSPIKIMEQARFQQTMLKTITMALKTIKQKNSWHNLLLISQWFLYYQVKNILSILNILSSLTCNSMNQSKLKEEQKI